MEPKRTSQFPAILMALACLCTAQQGRAEEEAFNNWFQIDVIIFRPTTANMDDESWPEIDFHYPPDVVDITLPRPFNISALSAMAAVDVPDEPADLQPTLSGGEFAFQRQSRGEYNRLIVADATGSGGSQDQESVSEVDEDDAGQFEADLDALLIPGQSEGQLAFTDPVEESALIDVLRSLNRSSRYRVLADHSWIQPVRGDPTPVIVQAGQRHDDLFEVEGTLSISVSRYLHVQADLLYTIFEPRGALPDELMGANPVPSEWANAYRDLAEVERNRGQYYPARHHAMHQTRRMRSGELHYMDHPLFGVMLYITRFEGPEESLEQ